MFPIQEVSDSECIFGYYNQSSIMPPYEDIKDYADFNDFNQDPLVRKYNKFFSDLFYIGVENLQLTPKNGVDPEKAWRHINSLIKSWVPKHEHKIAGFVFLMLEWFDNVTYNVKKK